MDKEKLSTELNGFIGTEHYYTGWLGVIITDGVAYLTSKAGWIVTDICSVIRCHKAVANADFVAIKIQIKDTRAVIRYEDGDGELLYEQKYKYTDLPDDKITLYKTNNTLMLNTEY